MIKALINQHEVKKEILIDLKKLNLLDTLKNLYNPVAAILGTKTNRDGNGKQNMLKRKI